MLSATWHLGKDDSRLMQSFSQQALDSEGFGCVFFSVQYHKLWNTSSSVSLFRASSTFSCSPAGISAVLLHTASPCREMSSDCLESDVWMALTSIHTLAFTPGHRKMAGIRFRLSDTHYKDPESEEESFIYLSAFHFALKREIIKQKYTVNSIKTLKVEISFNLKNSEGF